LLVVLAIAATVLMFLPKIRNSLPDLTERDEYRLNASRVKITRAPRYVPENLVAAVIEQSGLSDSATLLDEDLVGKVAAAFRKHPWVAEVISVRRIPPAQLQVEVTYRKPVGMVRVKQGMYPVDPSAILLPPTDFSVSDIKRFPKILNVQTSPEGPAGTNWGDVAVTGAARIAEALASRWQRFELVAILVPRQAAANTTINDLVYQLETAGGSRIVWGRAPRTNHPGELSTDRKIGRLQYLSDLGGFDRPLGPYEFDIRHWQEITRRPIAADSRRRLRQSQKPRPERRGQ
jgi:hypothetical protein